MSKLETPLTRRYWRSVGGTLMEEFRAVRGSAVQGRRDLDGVIVLGEPNRVLDRADHSKLDLRGKDIVVVQTKAGRLGMYLLGQALFSRELMRAFQPRTVMSVAVCQRDDAVLRPLAEKYGIEIVCYADDPS